MADIDYVAHSPRGKSVEDMTRKEVIKALRNKVPVEYVRDQFFTGEDGERPVEEWPVVNRKNIDARNCPSEPAGKPDNIPKDRRLKSRTG